MKVEELLSHHGLGRNPFAEEDADSDHVFKQQLEVAEAQILQDSKDAIEVLIVPRREYDRNSERRLMKEFRSRLGDEITEMAAHLTAGTCQLLELIAIFDEEGGWNGPGIASCANWLNWKCGMSMGTARERVRVARALPALPKILAAFRQGKVSYSKVRAMTRVATSRNEDGLLNVALHGTAFW